MTWEGAQPGPVLRVVFFRSASGREPVREWLLSLSREDRRRLGRRIKAAQYGWPIGMPVHEDARRGSQDGEAATCLDEGTRVMDERHVGGDFDDFLREQGLLEDAEAAAAKSVVAYQIAREMRRTRLTKSEMAKRMRTSRPVVDRLLDPKNPSVTLSTLERAASAVGKRLKVELI